LRKALTGHPPRAEPQRPGLGFASALSAFNRQERFFVTTQAGGLLSHGEMHGPSLPLGAAFRRRLGAVLGLDVPARAFAVVDFHLSWLHAALAWWRAEAWPGQVDAWPETSAGVGPAVVYGGQEDIDLLVTWQDENHLHIIAVEAKAYGAWSNSQFASKVARLGAIRSQCIDTEVDLRLVLTSRRRPEKLTLPTEPWTLDSTGEISWLPLAAPGLRLATMRCDGDARPSANGTEWRLQGPNGL
jgi:hypothetical protein